MLGPLPPKYRVVVAVCALIAFVGVGAWITFAVSGPLLTSTGAAVGAALGVAAAALLLHDFSRHHPRGPHAG